MSVLLISVWNCKSFQEEMQGTYEMFVNKKACSWGIPVMTSWKLPYHMAHAGRFGIKTWNKVIKSWI